jgi:MEDS: MEthanogen/methylotroph, DcmR Sensory domain/Histidine kinase-like ATPase domain
MAVGTREDSIATDAHVVHFYEHDAQLVAAVGPYLLAAVQTGDTAIMIATEPHRNAIEATLEADGIDLSQAAADGRLLALDAASTLAMLMCDGKIDREAFQEVIGGVMRRTAAASGRAVRAYGEMVSLLWDDGNVLAALELEALWNELGRELPFTLFCSYPATSVAGSEHAQALHHVCHLHSSVLTAAPVVSLTIEDRLSADSSTERAVRASLAPEPGAPAHARHLVADMLRRWGYGDRVVDDVTLVVSELTSNAVRHAQSQFSIEVEVQEGSALRVAVEDRMPLAASMPNGGLIPQPLHGLSLIEALCAGWGVQRTRDGKIVWAELACEAPEGAAPTSADAPA